MKTIILVGIPGVGKSSILQEVVRQIPTVLVINYGDTMLEEASSEGITRDLLRKMPLKEQQQIGIKAARKIVQQETDGIVIIDTHALIRTNTGFFPGLPLDVLEILSPIAYALVECSPQIILERRGQDSSRMRDDETKEELQAHQDLTRSFLTACCMHTGSILCCIQNNKYLINENASPLIRLIYSLH
ncbi:MAG: adenylate kinase [Chlamydiales bacterium]